MTEQEALPRLKQIELLREAYPILSDKSKAFATGIHLQIFDKLPENVSKKAVRNWLCFLCKRTHYLTALANNAGRYNADGSRAGDVEPHVQEEARLKLEARMKRREAIRLKREKKRQKLADRMVKQVADTAS